MRRASFPASRAATWPLSLAILPVLHPICTEKQRKAASVAGAQIGAKMHACAVHHGHPLDALVVARGRYDVGKAFPGGRVLGEGTYMHMGQLGACSASTPHFDAVTCKMDNVFGACALPIGPRRRTVGIGSGSCSLKRLRPGLGSLWLLWLPRRKHGSIHPLLPAHASLHPWPPWGRQGVHAHRDMFSHDFAAWQQPRPRPERPLDLHQPPASKSLVEPRITLVADSCAAASPWQVLIRWQHQLCVGSRCCASLLPPRCHPADPFLSSPPLPLSTIFGFGIEKPIFFNCRR